MQPGQRRSGGRYGAIALGAVVVALVSCGAPASPAASSPTGRPTTEPSVAPTVPTADVVYLALGDSNVYGSPEECGTPCETYPHLLAERISETGTTVALLDGSQHNGLTAPLLLREIQDDDWGHLPDYPVRTGGLSPRAAIAAADIITVTVNEIPWYRDPDSCHKVYDDACIEAVEQPFIDDLDAILSEIVAIRAGKPTAIRVTTFYNDLLKGPGYDPAWFEDSETIAQAKASAMSFLEQLVNDVCRVAAEHRAACVNLYRAVNGPDGDMPLPAGWYTKDFGDLNQGGHVQFADEIFKVGLEPVLPGS